MLKKENRLVRKKEFEEVKALGRVYQSPLFGLAILDKKDQVKKIGMVVSKKISKRAVDRNRIRRLLAEAVYRNWEEIRPGLRGVFLAKTGMLGKKEGEVEEEVRKVLESLKSKV